MPANIRKIYTGVGSRQTPPAILDFMADLAEALSAAGWTLRSGGADGADHAFESGAVHGAMEIYLPWRGFNGSRSPLYNVSQAALDMAGAVYPAWANLKEPVRKLHARNCYQVLGRNLDEPSRFLVCWTSDGAASESECTRATGGTAMAIRLASRFGVPIFNLRNELHKAYIAQLMAHL